MIKKRFLSRMIAVLTAVVMLIISAPIAGMADVDLGAVTASAATTKSGAFAKTLKWTYNTITRKLTISGKGAIPNYEFSYDNTFNIVTNTPWKKYDPISLEIKSGVTSIGDYAFSGCASLAKISVADTVTYIGSGNFDNSLWLMMQKSGSIYLGKVLYKFTDEKSTSVKVKDGTVSIAPDAFSGFILGESKLKSVTLPSSLKTIGSYAFAFCSSLKSITMPKNLKKIEEGAFLSCYALSSVELNEGITTIGAQAFRSCEKLKTIKIPSTVKKIDYAAFAGTSALTKITVPSSNKYYCSDKNGVLYNKAKTALIQYPAASKLTSYSAASTVKEIGVNAFYGAGTLKKITLPSSLKTIGESAFSDCGNLKTINFPSSVETADSIGIEGTNWYAVQPIGMIYIGKVAYSYKGNMSKNASISIKKGTISIASYAFSECENLATVKLPSTIKSIGEGAFSECYSLKSINLPSGLNTIGLDAFSCCESLKSVSIPSTVSSIGVGAFYDCESLTSIVIPAKVTTLYLGTFEDCSKLKSIKILNPLCKVGVEDEYYGWLYEDTVPKKAKIIAYKGSSAESYAKKNGNTFEALSPVSLEKCTVSKIANQKYTGKELTPAVTVKYKGAKLTSGKHFTATYKSNTKTGTAKVTIKGNAKYGFTGTVTTTFKIVK